MKALVMCLADPSGNPRPNRIIRLLAQEGYSVDILSYPFKGSLPVRSQYEIPAPSKSLFSRLIRLSSLVMSSLAMRAAWIPEAIAISHNDQRHKLLDAEKQLDGNNYSLLVVEDLQLLPLSFRLRGNARILFDAREFYTKQNDESIRFRFFEKNFRTFLCKKYLKSCDFLITVSPGLAKAYKQEFGVDMEVIRSTPAYREVPIQPCTHHQIRMVHHGAANKNRGLHNMIEIVRRLDSRFTLDFYLVGSTNKIFELKRMARDCPRIRFFDPVAFDEIVSMLNDYDIGLYYLEPNGFNVTYNLPNKLFEFIQARLAVAIGPSPNMAELVSQYQCGFVASEFSIEAMVKTLESLNPEIIDKAKSNSALAAKELCYERESRKILELIR